MGRPKLSPSHLTADEQISSSLDKLVMLNASHTQDAVLDGIALYSPTSTTYTSRTVDLEVIKGTNTEPSIATPLLILLP
jgi:hypothetical protein